MLHLFLWGSSYYSAVDAWLSGKVPIRQMAWLLISRSILYYNGLIDDDYFPWFSWKEQVWISLYESYLGKIWKGHVHLFHLMELWRCKMLFNAILSHIIIKQIQEMWGSSDYGWQNETYVAHFVPKAFAVGSWSIRAMQPFAKANFKDFLCLHAGLTPFFSLTVYCCLSILTSLRINSSSFSLSLALTMSDFTNIKADSFHYKSMRTAGTILSVKW